MKINDNRIAPGRVFGQLEQGDVFYISRIEGNDGDSDDCDLYMKTSVEKRQCVNLVNGSLWNLGHWDEVELVCATIEVTNYTKEEN